MADILEGNTDHATWAPLSHAQTISINKYLQEQIRRLEAELNELRGGLGGANGFINNLRDALDRTNANVQGLQDGLGNTDTLLDATRKDLGRAKAGLGKLQSGLGDTNESVQALREGQRVTRANLQKTDEGLKNTQDAVANLQEALEKRVFVDIASLKEQHNKTQLALDQLRADENKNREGLQEAKDGLRGLAAEAKGIQNDLLKTNTVVHILEQRLTDTAGILKTTRQNVDELNGTTRKLTEGLEHQKANMSEVQNGVKKVGTHVKLVQDGLESTTKGLQVTMGKLDNTANVLDATRQGCDSLKAHVQALRDGHSRTQATINNMQGELCDVGNTANEVHASLRETNAMVLPNLHLDSSGPAAMHSARSGRGTQANLIKKVQNSTAPNRMAWI